MAEKKVLSPDEIKKLMLPSKGEKGSQTEPREISVWYKLNHLLREEGCSNPQCVDSRPHSDRGRHIVIELNGKYICRYCFLDGYLSHGRT